MPGLILSAPASGSGKTVIAAGLLRHLRRRGLRVAAAKAGPDYIDPTFHAAAGGAPCCNLDSWAMRPETLAGLVGDLEHSADIVICEGAMGLFDGGGPDGEAGSTAELAKRTGWPVVLAVDAAGQGASVAALVAGFARHDPDVPLAGIILNRVGGARHRQVLESALARHLPELPCLGAIGRDPQLALPSRHLGLVPAGEHDAAGVVGRAADAVAAAIDIDRLLALAKSSVIPGRGAAPRPESILQRSVFLDSEPGLRSRNDQDGRGIPVLGAHVTVARDDAFAFAYPVQLEAWRRAGAALSFFSPLADEAPHPAADALFLPGGYPELHAGQIAAAATFLSGLHAAAEIGKPVYGECGGYMVLGEALTDAAGCAHAMAGLLPLRTSFAERRLHLGYREAALLGETPLGKPGARFRGHEFHYATVVSENGAEPLFAVSDASATHLGRYGLRRGSVFGSFLHLIDRAD